MTCIRIASNKIIIIHMWLISRTSYKSCENKTQQPWFYEFNLQPLGIKLNIGDINIVAYDFLWIVDEKNEQNNKSFNNRSALYHLLNVPFEDDHYYFMNDAGGMKYGILQSDEYDSTKYNIYKMWYQKSLIK